MDLLGSFQALVLFALALAAFGMSAFALVDAVRRPADAFRFANKRTKTLWVVILGVATALTFVLIQSNPLSIFGLLSVVAAGVYLADVRPAVRQYRQGGGSNRGPYGGW